MLDDEASDGEGGNDAEAGDDAADESEGGEGDDSSEPVDLVDPDDTRIYVGACEVAGQGHKCVVYNNYGCLQGFQECVDGEWTDCFRGEDS